MSDDTKGELADVVYADLMTSGARTRGEMKAALMASLLSLESPLVIEVAEPTEEDRRLRRTPLIAVTMPRLPGEG